MIIGYEIKAMRKDAQAMRKRMRKMMFGYKIKAMHKGCANYVQENLQDYVWV